MEAHEILRLYDEEMRRDAPEGRAKIYKQPGLTFFTVPPPSPRKGWVIYSRLDPTTAEATIRSTIEFYRQQGGEFEWKVYGHDTPLDLKKRLLAHGFVSEDLESVLALDLDSAPPAFWEPSAVRVERLTHSDQLADVARIEDEVFAEDSFDIQTVLGIEMRETPGSISVYVAYADGVPASSAWIRFSPERQFAELYGGATIATQRGKGLYRALVQARAGEARQRGVRFLVVDTSPMSRPILERNGFVFLTHAQGFVMEFGEGAEATSIS